MASRSPSDCIRTRQTATLQLAKLGKPGIHWIAFCCLRPLGKTLIPTPRPRAGSETASVRFVFCDRPMSGAKNQLYRSARVWHDDREPTGCLSKKFGAIAAEPTSKLTDPNVGLPHMLLSYGGIQKRGCGSASTRIKSTRTNHRLKVAMQSCHLPVREPRGTFCRRSV